MRLLLIKRKNCHHIETSQLICSPNQLTGFYMIATMAFNDLIFLVLSQYGLACKYGKIVQISMYNWMLYCIL